MSAYNHIEKIKLLPATTPLCLLEQLSIKYQQTLYIKRDDLTGIGAGGNKLRKLEYLFADALQKDATTVITGGGVQSNHAAMTAVCAKKLGLECHIALADAVPIYSEHYQRGGNVFLEQLADAKLTRFAKGLSSGECIEQLANKITADSNDIPYIIPMGGSNAIGALGYVDAANELLTQLNEQNITLDSIVLGSGSAGTQAGLLMGLLLAGSNIKVLGVSVLAQQNDLINNIDALCVEIAEILGVEQQNWRQHIYVDDGYIGEGYGIAQESTWQAIKTLISEEGIICDPCYTGKALDGWLDILSKRDGSLGQNSLFWHTGGVAGLFGYV
ncbi:D-cysteine desulfhydrase family protein [Thalassotalea psychrophila]|uniref:D-cysteine desulfhydrase family protein n=1 Tax=Thalassotalea psychrophila TaxID=3065647 RepID=A0ABY9U0A1_9GAMM|nr:D-cysteine desulfhydrase family protein [Colwelliaceae bacterium SQ149]